MKATEVTQVLTERGYKASEVHSAIVFTDAEGHVVIFVQDTAGKPYLFSPALVDFVNLEDGSEVQTSKPAPVDSVDDIDCALLGM